MADVLSVADRKSGVEVRRNTLPPPHRERMEKITVHGLFGYLTRVLLALFCSSQFALLVVVDEEEGSTVSIHRAVAKPRSPPEMTAERRVAARCRGSPKACDRDVMDAMSGSSRRRTSAAVAVRLSSGSSRRAVVVDGNLLRSAGGAVVVHGRWGRLAASGSMPPPGASLPPTAARCHHHHPRPCGGGGAGRPSQAVLRGPAR